MGDRLLRRPRCVGPGGWRTAATAAFLFATSSNAFAQVVSDLPSPGNTVRIGDLRNYLPENTNVPLANLGWTFTPGVDITQAYNTSQSTGTGASSYQTLLSTTVAPTLSVTGESRRISLAFSYNPQAVLVEEGNSSSYVAQNFGGTGHVIIVPETLFLDVSAFGFLQSTSGNAGSNAASAFQTNQAQTYTVTAAPYLQHRFGGTGVGEIGYSASYSEQGNPITQGPVITTAGVFPQTTTASNLFTQSEYASFVTGEDFARLQVQPQVQASQYSGSATYSGAHAETELVQVGYAVSRFFTALGEIGHETIDYPNFVPPYRLDDIVWYAGGRVTFGPDSHLTATYGHRYGTGNLFIEGVFSPTARLQIYTDFSQAITTNLEDIQTASNQAQVLASGAVIDRTTGSPIVLAENVFGINTGLYRQTRGSVNAVLGYDRDVFSASIVTQTEKILAQAAGTQPANFQGSTRGAYASLTWSHDLSPAVTTSLSGTFGKQKQNSNTSGYQDIYGATASATYRISATLSAQALYSYSRSPSYSSSAGTTYNTALITLSKRF